MLSAESHLNMSLQSSMHFVLRLHSRTEMTKTVSGCFFFCNALSSLANCVRVGRVLKSQSD